MWSFGSGWTNLDVGDHTSRMLLSLLRTAIKLILIKSTSEPLTALFHPILLILSQPVRFALEQVIPFICYVQYLVEYPSMLLVMDSRIIGLSTRHYATTLWYCHYIPCPCFCLSISNLKQILNSWIAHGIPLIIIFK